MLSPTAVLVPLYCFYCCCFLFVCFEALLLLLVSQACRHSCSTVACTNEMAISGNISHPTVYLSQSPRLFLGREIQVNSATSLWQGEVSQCQGKLCHDTGKLGWKVGSRTYVHQLDVVRWWVGVVWPIGHVHHVVPLWAEALPKAVMQLFPLLPVYETRKWL